MRLHSDSLSLADIKEAARLARVSFDKLSEHGSRKRAHGYEVTLHGGSRRRPNYGNGNGEDYAATWDQWGVFLGQLFRLDPDMVTPYDASGADFNRRTFGRFLSAGFPADYHGDHVFRYAGVPYHQACTKCTAEQTWEPLEATA